MYEIIIHCINQYPLASKMFSHEMEEWNIKLANMAHVMKVGQIRLILRLYQSLNEIPFTDCPRVRAYPEAKKNKAFPCTPNVAKAVLISLYKGI